MLYYNRIDLSEGIKVTKGNNSKKCMVCHYCFFFNRRFKFQDSVCNVCQTLTMLCLSLGDIVIIIVKNVDYYCIIHNISKSDTIHLLEYSVLDDRGYI